MAMPAEVSRAPATFVREGFSLATVLEVMVVSTGVRAVMTTVAATPNKFIECMNTVVVSFCCCDSRENWAFYVIIGL